MISVLPGVQLFFFSFLGRERFDRGKSADVTREEGIAKRKKTRREDFLAE